MALALAAVAMTGTELGMQYVICHGHYGRNDGLRLSLTGSMAVMFGYGGQH
jgi:hypothetical protein